MAPPYDAISRRNLQELESDLTLILRSPPPPPVVEVDEAAAEADEGAAPTIATSLHSDMVRRFEFLKNLITLEEESIRGDKPEHLDHMKNRLASLEDAYHQWLLSGTSSPLAQTSPCACTSSCFDQGDGDDWMELFYDETPPAEEELPVAPAAVPLCVEGETPPAEEELPVEPAAVPLCVEEGVGRSTEETRSWATAHGRKVCTLGGAVKLLAAAVAAGSLVLASMWAVKDEEQFLLVPT